MSDQPHNEGTIPSLYVRGRTIPEAWERALLAVWDRGVKIPTEYDRPGDPPSREATVLVRVEDPFAEPRLHRNFPGGPAELEVYRQEVVDGIHDHWVKPDGWKYTYHERLFAYLVVDDLTVVEPKRFGEPIDQLELALDRLARTGHTRRAQAITWMPTVDPAVDDPPCLQRLWLRLLPGANGGLTLSVNTHWRSRDLYKAWFMNVFALTDLQRLLAARLAEKTGRPVRTGAYVDVSDSLHIYGSYEADVAREIEKMKASSDYQARAWNSDHPAFQEIVRQTRERLAKDPDYMKHGG